MLKNKKITIAMSGGIDSAVAALLLSREGAEISGATMRLCQRLLPDGNDASDIDITDAKAICDKLGIIHRVYDFKKEFHSYRKVIFIFVIYITYLAAFYDSFTRWK